LCEPICGLKWANTVTHLLKRSAVAGLVSISFAGVPTQAFAYRPFDGTDAAVAESGQLEIELGPAEFLWEGSDRTLVAPNLRLNYGFSERWEFVLEGLVVLTIRLIGVIEARQRKKGERWIQNDRILAVATHAHTHEHVRSLDDLRPGLVDEIEDFFRHYNEMKGTEFKPVDRGGPKKAQKLLDQAAVAFREKQKDDGKAE
jgi:hypothetical protein